MAPATQLKDKVKREDQPKSKEKAKQKPKAVKQKDAGKKKEDLPTSILDPNKIVPSMHHFIFNRGDPKDLWTRVEEGGILPMRPMRVHGAGLNSFLVMVTHPKSKMLKFWEVETDGGRIVIPKEIAYRGNKAELIYKVLVNRPDHASVGYWYEWISYERFTSNVENRTVVVCGDIYAPVVNVLAKKKPRVGYFNSVTKTVYMQVGQHEMTMDISTNGLFILTRNYEDIRPFCYCPHCEKTAVEFPEKPRLVSNEHRWFVLREGDFIPDHVLVAAMHGHLQSSIRYGYRQQFVALWFKKGVPVIGFAFKDQHNRVRACFGWMNMEYIDDVGTFQVLLAQASHIRSFFYSWLTPDQIDRLPVNQCRFVRVEVENGGIMIPCVVRMPFDGKQVLGQLDPVNRIAFATWYGREHYFTVPDIFTFPLLVAHPKNMPLPIEPPSIGQWYANIIELD